MSVKYCARYYVEIYALIFIVNFIYYLKKITCNIFKSANNILLIIVKITKKVEIYLNYNTKIFFTL